MGGDATEGLVAYWAAQHTLVLWRGRPKALVQAATHAVLARLRAFRAAGDLLAWPELSDREEAALIRSLLPDAPDALVQQIRGAARHLRWAELAAGEARRGRYAPAGEPAHRSAQSVGSGSSSVALDVRLPLAGALRVLPSPSRALYRLGHAPDPLAWPPWEVVGRNRFDDPGGRFRVLYAATRRRCCFAEALAPPSPRPLPAGWLTSRRLGRLRLAPGQHWLDLRVVESREALRAILAPLVLGVGMADLDGAAVRSPERRLKRAIAAWAHDAGFQGIVYTSRLDDLWACWAIFEGAELVPVGAPRPIRRGDRDLLATAALFHLSV